MLHKSWYLEKCTVNPKYTSFFSNVKLFIPLNYIVYRAVTMPIDVKRMGRRLRFARSFILGESQRALAKRIGATHKSVCFWETGKTVPPVKILVKISEEVGKTVDWLLGIEPDKTLDG